MARKRQARRCKARRTDGEPCRAYAILGGETCTAHSGAAPQVRAAALYRYWSARVGFAYDQGYRRWRREVFEWEVQRWLAAASVLGVSPEELHPGDILLLAIDGKIPGEDTMPKLRVDRRYGPRIRAQLATRAARQAARKAGPSQAT